MAEDENFQVINCKTQGCNGHVYFNKSKEPLPGLVAQEINFMRKKAENLQLKVYLTCDNPDGPTHTNLYII